MNEESNKNLNHNDILIVGAGPTGLVLAIALKQLGINVRIIDKELQAGTSSRALVVHARTLEFYEQLGILEKIISNGLKFSAVNLWVQGEKKAHLVLNNIGEGLSPFPYMLILPQDVHERILIEELNNLGVSIERGIELLDYGQNTHVWTRLKKRDDQEEIYQSLYIAGCDGAHSTLRSLAKLNFKGSTYPQYFYVADVEATGVSTNQELHLSLDEIDFVAIFPLKEKIHARLIGIVGQKNAQKPKITWQDVQQQALSRLDLQIKKINWFSSYHVHHRIASCFSVEHLFLLGDAAHIHSPVGGQGMNTGIGDAINLAWKLADVIKNKAHVSILDSYAIERMAFAKKLVATTDRAFSLIIRPGPIARFVRLVLLPPLLSFLFQFDFFRLFFFKNLSQIAISYSHSPLSYGWDTDLKSGDRMVWDQNIKTPLPFKWNIRLYGNASSKLIKFCHSISLTLDVQAWNSSLLKYGLKKNVIYLIRPDGHIGFLCAKKNIKYLKKYFKRFYKTFDFY